MRQKRLWALLLCCIILLLVCATGKKINASATPAAITLQHRPVVIIDAGHGGFDGGAVAEDGTLEKDLNLQIALKVEALAKLQGLHTVMVRTQDVSTDGGVALQTVSRKVADMKNRLQLMRDYPNCIYVSIHQNKYTTSQPKGTQVFYAPKIAAAKTLAECLQSAVSGGLQPENHRAIKPGTKDTYLLYYAAAPAVIVECGFMSHPQELQNLKQEIYQQKIALCIVNGILSYYCTPIG